MATKQTKSNAANMFSVRERPKRHSDNFKGRSIDPAKLEFLTNLFTGFAEYAAGNELDATQDIVINELGGYEPGSLAITGNKILDNQRDNGTDPGFYLVATDRPELDETDKNGKAKYGPAETLVIRMGQRPTRNRKNGNQETDSE